MVLFTWQDSNPKSLRHEWVCSTAANDKKDFNSFNVGLFLALPDLCDFKILFGIFLPKLILLHFVHHGSCH